MHHASSYTITYSVYSQHYFPSLRLRPSLLQVPGILHSYTGDHSTWSGPPGVKKHCVEERKQLHHKRTLHYVSVMSNTAE